MTERLCACPCKRSLEGMRKDARWYSRACAVRWSRENPGRSLNEAHSANKARTHTASERGVQLSYYRAFKSLTAHTDLDDCAIEAPLRDALPPAQLSLSTGRSEPIKGGSLTVLGKIALCVGVVVVCVLLMLGLDVALTLLVHGEMCISSAGKCP